jgi:hypothetical protein
VSLLTCQDIEIAYEPVAAESKINTTFNSVVEYHKQTAAEGSKPSTGQYIDDPFHG